MSVRAAVAVATGAAAVAALGLGAVFGDQWAQAWTGAEQRAVAAGTRTVQVAPAEETRVCPAPVRLPKGADVGDEQFDATPVETRSSLGTAVLGAAPASDGIVAPRTTGLGGGDATELTGGAKDGSAAVTQGDVDGTRVLRATPVAGEPFRSAGSLASVTTRGDLRGLAAGECAEPATSHWLVGGATNVGATSTLVVQNPTERPASVTLDVYGPGGPVALGGGGTFTVAAHEQVTTRMESIAPEQDRLVVHVASSGARVTAALQRQGIDGLVPAGVDLVTAGTAPRSALAVGGVRSHGETVDDPHAPRLRLLAPGDDGGTARISVYGPDGRVVLRGASRVDLKPGVVTDVPLGGLPTGTYAVVVDADVPVTGGARFDQAGEQPEDSVVTGTPYDVAWSRAQAAPRAASVAEVAEGSPLGTVALPDRVRAKVALAGVPAERGTEEDPEGTATVTLRAYDAEGAEVAARDVDVTAGGTVDVPVADLLADAPDDAAPVALRVDRAQPEGADTADGAGAETGVVWSVLLVADDDTPKASTLVATLAPTPASTTPGDVTVRSVDAG